MNTLLPDTLRMARVAVEPGPRHTARERERAASLAAVRLLAGPDAQIGHHPDGAPYIIGRNDVTLTLSHDALEAVAAIAPYAIGLDAETLRPQLRRVMHKFVSPAEQAIHLPDPDTPTALHTLMLLWTAKEAVYKLLRTPGLPLTAITVGPTLTTITVGPTLTTATVPSHAPITLTYPHLTPTRAICVAVSG